MSTAIKICGVREISTLELLNRLRVEYTGFVFFPRSPRHLTFAEASDLRAHTGALKVVAVTVDADDAALEGIIAHAKPHFLQLHGNESPARVSEIKERFALPVIKALKVKTAEDVLRAREYENTADHILFDAPPPVDATIPGGNGVSFDWNLLREVKRENPWFLSGGLTPENVSQAIRLTHAPMVDVSSGVESSPGVKDTARIEAFTWQVRQL